MANAIINVGSTGGQVNISTAAAPATPAVGVVTLYAGTDKALHALNSDGTDITIAAAGAASPITVQQTCSLVSTAIGATAASGVNCAVSIGNNARLFAGATGTIVIGNTSNGGTGACNSVVIGNSNCVIGINSVVIGKNATNVGVAGNAVVIGNCACTNAGLDYGGHVVIGYNARGGYAGAGVVIGQDAIGDSDAVGILNCSVGTASVSIGKLTRSAGLGGVSIGYNTNAGGNFSISNISIGKSSSNSSALGSINIGDTSVSSSDCTIAMGLCSTIFTGATGSVVIGANSTGATGIANAVVLGPNLTSVKANTTHVNSLIAYGQAASITNAVGSTGGSVTLNWDNSNIQTVTLTSNITTLTKSNPIDGAVYTLFLTQGASGGYTVAWGADVEWAGGTGPTLSTAAGAVDAVSLVYIAGVTGYYGNANLNFS